MVHLLTYSVVPELCGWEFCAIGTLMNSVHSSIWTRGVPMAKSFLEIMEQREEITKGEWTLYYPIGPRIAWLRGIGMRCKCNTPNSTGIICAFPVAKTLGEPTFPIPPYLRTHSTHIIPNRLSSIKSHITLCPNVITAWTKFPSRFFARSVLQSVTTYLP